jgi:hypothetical protein
MSQAPHRSGRRRAQARIWHYTWGDYTTGQDMGAADKRIADLLDRWMASVELHARYLDLDAAAYAKVQDWPRHQRPTRWIVDLARTRLQELRRELVDRQAKGDADFAESLELMSFLTTLLGSEHIERFIPLAVPKPREPAQDAAAPAPRRTAARTAAEPPAARPRTTKAAAMPARPARTEKPPKPDKLEATVIADAARLLSWGREWPQLAGLIARLADRPPEKEVWAILRTHRATIEAKARRIPD